jgi:hypothetical protein
MQARKPTPPDRVVADLFYGFGNNAAGDSVCSHDVCLSRLWE